MFNIRFSKQPNEILNHLQIFFWCMYVLFSPIYLIYFCCTMVGYSKLAFVVFSRIKIWKNSWFFLGVSSYFQFCQVVITKCYHLFCNSCIQKVAGSRQRKCPQCGACFGANDVKPVYL
jgi:hypothetical protein